MKNFFENIWKWTKEYIFGILIFLSILFVLSYTIGIGVRYFPNFGTYGDPGEWFSFWGNVVGGVISTLVAAGVAFFVSKKENGKATKRDREIAKMSALINIKLDMLKDIYNDFTQMKKISDKLGASFYKMYKKAIITEFEGQNLTIIDLYAPEIDEFRDIIEEFYFSFFKTNLRIKRKIEMLRVFNLEEQLDKYYELSIESYELMKIMLDTLGDRNEEKSAKESILEIRSKIESIEISYDELINDYYNEFYKVDVDALL